MACIIVCLSIWVSIAVAENLQSETPVGDHPRSAAVFYLVAPDKTDELKESLESLCRYMVVAYPIVLFRGSAMTAQSQQGVLRYVDTIASRCKSPWPSGIVQWSQVPGIDPDRKLNLKTFFRSERESLLSTDASELEDMVVRRKTRSLFRRESQSSGTQDYNSMIEFWVKIAPKIAQDRGYKYVMRLDTDSVLLSTLAHDPFARLSRMDATYAYRAFCYENPDISKPDKVWPVLVSYMGRHGIKPSSGLQAQIAQGGPLPMFYTNFEILNVSFFARPEVVLLGTTFIHQPGLRYHKEAEVLGDAVIRAFQVGLFADYGKVVHLSTFQYRHGRCPRNITAAQCFNSSTTINIGDPFEMQWGASPTRFGTPVGHCRLHS